MLYKNCFQFLFGERQYPGDIKTKVKQTFLFLVGGRGANKVYFMVNVQMVNGTLVTVNQSKQFCNTVKQSFRDTHLHYLTISRRGRREYWRIVTETR